MTCRPSVFVRALLIFATAMANDATASWILPMDGGEGPGRITLPDGRAAVQFEANAPQDTRATWKLESPVEPGWYTVELGFVADKATRKLANLDWLDAAGAVVLSVDVYYAPNASGTHPAAVLGVYLARPASAVAWRKNQTRNVRSTALATLNIKPGRPPNGAAFMEAVDAPLASGKVQIPTGLGSGHIRAVSANPVALEWLQANGSRFRTPAGTATSVFLDSAPVEITAESGDGTANRLHLELRPDSPSPVDPQVLASDKIPLAGDSRQRLRLEVKGTNLDSGAARLADFPGGARMAAVQSWDDGIPQDFRAARMLWDAGWRATFFLNRHSAIIGQCTDLEKLGMEIGSHSWSHPAYWLQSPKRCHEESLGLRLFLESKLGHPVISFGYPFNYQPAYDASGDYVLRALRDAGYLAGRSTMNGPLRLDDPADPLAMKTTAHFLTARDKLEAAWQQAESTRLGIFYIWGHTYEITSEAEWAAFGELLKSFGNRPGAWYASQGDLMVWKFLRDHTTVKATGDAASAVIEIESPALHPWWAARVPLAIHIPGEVASATMDGKPLPIANGEIQIHGSVAP